MSVRWGNSVVLVAVVACSLLAGLGAGVWVVSAASPTAGPAPHAQTPQETQTAQEAQTAQTAQEAQTADDDLACPTDRHTPSNHELAQPRIVEVAPNPPIDGNVGEFVVLETPPETRVGNWTLTDGHTTATLPNETVSGRTAVSANPNTTDSLTDDPVLELEGTVRFAADGDELELQNGSRTIDAVSYDRAPSAQRWYRSDAGVGAGTASDTETASTDGQWWPRDATCVPVSSTDVDETTAFVLPDDTAVPLEPIRDADDRLLLGGYTITSEDVAAELVAAAERGVDVSVLLEASPVGGTPAESEPVLETLAASDADIDVRATGGEGARYRFHHPKYAVADDEVLVTTENWDPSGVGGESSRGWGVRLEEPTLAAELATVFEADFAGWDTEPGADYLEQTSFVEDDDEFGAGTGTGTGTETSPSYPAEHDPQTLPADSAELLVAPDNAEGRLQTLLDEADDEILVKQASIDSDLSLLEETVDAARRGVSVRILLDSTWYHEDDNEALAAELERTASAEDLPLEVRLVDDTDRFEKIHAKGVVIDREVAVVGSANWNENAFENNREVLLAVHGSEPADYYAAVFEDDWDGDSWSLPIGMTVVSLVALVLAALVGRRYVRFGDEPN